jgi:hypothetical protein
MKSILYTVLFDVPAKGKRAAYIASKVISCKNMADAQLTATSHAVLSGCTVKSIVAGCKIDD